jgi:hypothetical protein
MVCSHLAKMAKDYLAITGKIKKFIMYNISKIIKY